MDGDFVPYFGGRESRATAFMFYQNAEYWKARALLAESDPNPPTNTVQVEKED